MKNSLKLNLFVGLFSLTSVTSLTAAEVNKEELWRNESIPVEKRVDDLLSKLTVEEKIDFLNSELPAIKRLSIPEYVWYSEALHGVIAWNCTSFPQNNAMGSTWNTNLMYQVATAISDEARALKNMGKKEVMIYSPTVNMSRDPRWGRNEECYSEDPFHMSSMARMYIRGMQGDDPKYLKTVCTVKHFAANNVEHKREQIQSIITEKDLREYYFPGFKTCVDDGAQGIMSALNGLNNIPCSAHKWLLTDVLRGEWGFKGYVVADWSAVGSVTKFHKYTDNNAEGCVAALRAGCDQECFRRCPSPMVKGIHEAYKKGLVSEDEINVSVRRLLRLLFLTGEFDNMNNHKYGQIKLSVLESPKHRALALEAAKQSIVLLKNESDILPLSKDVKSIAVVGPFADYCWLGIYSGFPKNRVSPLKGIRNLYKGKIHYAKGCEVTSKNDTVDMNNAIKAASQADVVLAFVGNDEKTSTENLDRSTLLLPGRQSQLLDELCKVNKNVIAVITPSGSTLLGNAQESLKGIVCSWANGQEQGDAIASVLFGDYNPGGKLNTTWYASDNNLPSIHDYNIAHNHTYMYLKDKPLYPFGYGLSYTDFKFSGLSISKKELKANEKAIVSFKISNVGKMDGDEVAQLYIRNKRHSKDMPEKQLKSFKRVHLAKSQSATVNLELLFEDFKTWDEQKKNFVVNPGEYEILVGSSSQDIHLAGSISVAYGIVDKTAKEKIKSEILDNGYVVKYDTTPYIASSDGEKGSLCFDKIYTFYDPGFFVSQWDAAVEYTSSANSVIKVYLDGTLIDEFSVESSRSDMKKMNFKIPIPAYGVPLKLEVYKSAGDIKIKSVDIISPAKKN